MNSTQFCNSPSVGDFSSTRSPWQATVLSLFPEAFPGPLGLSIAGKALKNDLWSLDSINIRDYATDRHASVDDIPFGGGAGMVIKPDVMDSAIAANHDPENQLIYLTPKGKPLSQSLAHDLSRTPGVTLICGRYEGVDQRVLDKWQPMEISVGDYVLSGGEIAALTLLDAIIRLLPDVIGDTNSLNEESFAQGLLEYPHYTRPKVWQDRAVPDILTSGHHQQIHAWRLEQAQMITEKRRPDMIKALL